MKKNIALVAGGYSGEYAISVQSAVTIEQHLDLSRYDLYKIMITRNDWFYIDGSGNRILVDKNDFSLTLNRQKILFDAAFIGIHGAPGEDGKLQGYFDMLQIPYTGCSAVTSAVTFNKSFCNKIISSFGIVKVAKSLHLFKDQPFEEKDIGGSLRFPVFVKPAEGGSSLGVSKVMSASEALGEAIEKAFQEDSQVLIEEYIKGRELTCGLFKTGGKVTALPVTEIISSKDFFDYEAKYTAGVSREITPAEIEEDIALHIQDIASQLYNKLNCRGVVRMDFILEEKSNELYFLEANTMPGQAAGSIVPQQVKAAGLSLANFYALLIEEALISHKNQDNHKNKS